MAQEDEDSQPDFEQAMGEEFGEAVAPPVDFESASAHECCEVIWSVLGRTVTPRMLDRLTGRQVEELSLKFGEYFECDSPSIEQIKEAIANTLARWPVGSIGD